MDYPPYIFKICISSHRSPERDYTALNIDWPIDRIDFDNAMLLPRSREDVDEEYKLEMVLKMQAVFL